MSSTWEKAADVSELPAGKMKSFMLGGEEVLLANIGGTFYAIRNRCTHMGGPLSRGVLNGHVVTCPLHGSKFDVETGKVMGPPATLPERTFEVKVQGTSVMLRKPA